MVKKYIKGTEKNNIMRKLVVAFVICLLILTIGCQQQAKEETKKIKPVQAEEKILPQGTVLVGEIHPNATGTTIQINDMRDIFKKVEYKFSEQQMENKLLNLSLSKIQKQTFQFPSILLLLNKNAGNIKFKCLGFMITIKKYI